MLKFYYRDIGGVIRSYDIVPVYFSHGGYVPECSIFAGYWSREFIVFDGVLAN